jgi:ribosome biogenesis GTPase A
VPNVGKSTLINTLVGVKKAKTGDEAGITRAEQRIVLADDFYLWDTPGMLWPRITMPRAGFHLAAAGSIGRNAYDEQEVAVELLRTLKQPYEGLLRTRFRLPAEIDGRPIAQTEDEVLLDAIGKARGAVQSRGRVDTQKAAEIVLNDFRSAVLGRITLETPEEFALWQAEADSAEQERRIKKLSRTAKGRAELAEEAANEPQMDSGS